jgi:hypothetical protein
VVTQNSIAMEVAPNSTTLPDARTL